MKSQALSCSLIASAASELGFNPKRDMQTVVERVSCEGYQFLSITLPRLSDQLLAGLESSLLPSLEGWKKKRGTEIPEFLQDLWSLIFSPTGCILPEPSVRAIYWIRQISCAFKKVFEVCDPQFVEASIDKFINTDLSLPRRVYAPHTLSSVTHWLFGKPVGRAICNWESVFQNGPGAVADRLDVNERWDFPTISPHIQAAFGADRFRSSWGDLLFHYPQVMNVPARLVAVPKTATKPRLISIEPSHNQYLQQSLMSALYDELCSTWATNIRDQVPNQDLARSGSIDRSLATIDLSDASDRISNELVLCAFDWNESFLNFLQGTRSYEVAIPGRRETFFLRKFASMGSALTFPVETMVFTAIVIMGMCTQDGDISPSRARKHLRSGDVRVYGDDIIVPSRYYQTVVNLLQRYGLAVNVEKSYHTGFFRESCGKDWYQGVDVTPKYVRRPVDNGPLSSENASSLCSLHNQLFEMNGDCPTTDLIRSWIEEDLPGLPTISIHSPQEVGGLYLLGHSREGIFRTNPKLHSLEVKTYYLSAKQPVTRGGYMGKLLQTLAGPKSEDPDRLYRGGRPVSARLKYGWRSVL